MNSRDKINLEELSEQSASYINDFIDSICDDQAFDSDIGGDSDADDNIPDVSVASSSGYTKRKNSSTGANEVLDFDSDDSVADPDFEPHPTKRRSMRNIDYSFSSDDEEPLSKFVHEPSLEIAQPRDQTDLPWTKSPFLPHVFEAVAFEQIPGPRIAISESPAEIFSSVLGDDFLKVLVSESNRYAQQKKASLDLTLEELKAFIGILIIMGFHSLPSIRLYWSSDQNFHNTRISDIMSLKRFLKILRFLHINDNEAMPQKGDPKFDKLYKVRPMISYLSNSFLSAYSPDRNLSVDESMVAFKGRTHLKQYMPLKPIKRGIKIWALACSSTGYLLRFSVYEGKKESDEDGPLGERTVLELTKPFQGKYYCVYFDNFFTSFSLLSKLLDRKLFGCGTMRSNRKNFPGAFLVPDKDLKQGESDTVGTSVITVDKWKDRGKKCVLVANTLRTVTDKSTVQRMTKEGVKVTVDCPRSIDDYNKNMGGVDLFDQLHSCYNLAWKSRRWWLKLFYYFVDASIVNSYILYKTGTSTNCARIKPKSHLVFRSILANQLIGDFSSKKMHGSWLVIGNNKMKKIDGRSVTVENSVRMANVGDHFPTHTTSRRCARCSTEKKPKRSSMACTKCGVALCLPCFAPFHNK